jgi:50S ribosomal protein L16 3-hydroxylase
MLDHWLSPMPVTAFARRFLRRQPYACPSTAGNTVGYFQWTTLERLLAEQRSADVLIVAKSQLLDLPTPRTPTALRELLAAGVGLVIRHGERHDEGIARVATSLSERIPGKVQAQLFVTPAATYGFGWHYDDEDVFVVQTSGTKDYFFRDNTILRDRSADTADFTRFHSESSPIASARLIPGDFLYIPSRWWHMAKCTEDSLSISLGLSVDETWLKDVARSQASRQG